ncbi:hypothetical protein BsWGS_23693 [Bradybaena similaris]
MMKTSILLLVAVILGSTDAQNYSKKVWDFVATSNGYFTNKARLSKNFTRHTLLKILFKPVSAPAMGLGPFMLVEIGEGESKLEFRHFIIPSDGGDNVVKVTPYHFTDWDKDSPGQFDTDKLATYSKDDFWTDPTWVGGIEMIAPGIFFGCWPVPTHFVNGTRPTWSVIFGCNLQSATIPVGADEARDVIPYYYNREGDKFPLINPPDDYVSPCDQQWCPCGKS